jgi:hypothetical protein
VHGGRRIDLWVVGTQVVLEEFVIEKEPRYRFHKHVVSPPNQMKIRPFRDHKFSLLHLLLVKRVGIRSTGQPQVLMDLV